MSNRKEYQSCAAVGLRHIVLRHYSQPNTHPHCQFPGCEEIRLEELTLDHTNGGGNEEAIRYAQGKTFPNLYQWLIRNGFPPGYQTLCKFHNFSKPKRMPGRIVVSIAFDWDNPIPNAREVPLWEAS